MPRHQANFKQEIEISSFAENAENASHFVRKSETETRREKKETRHDKNDVEISKLAVFSSEGPFVTLNRL